MRKMIIYVTNKAQQRISFKYKNLQKAAYNMNVIIKIILYKKITIFPKKR